MNPNQNNANDNYGEGNFEGEAEQHPHPHEEANREDSPNRHRVSTYIFVRLMNLLKRHPSFRPKDFMMLLYYLANAQSNFGMLASMFNFDSPEEVFVRLESAALLACSILTPFFPYPNSSEQRVIEYYFCNMFRFPGVIGVLHKLYITCRNGEQMLVQLLCDHKRQYRGFFLSSPYEYDLTFSNWEVLRGLQRPSSNNFYVVASRGYPSLHQLFPPLEPTPDSGVDDEARRININHYHSQLLDFWFECTYLTFDFFPKLNTMEIPSKPIITCAILLHNVIVSGF